MGLIEDDGQVFKIFEEACNIMMPKELRQFFAWFLISDNLPFAIKIWNNLKKYFCDDYKDNQEYNALKQINITLNLENYSLSDFGLPNIGDIIIEKSAEEKKIFEETNNKLFDEYKNQLNKEQNIIFNYIIQNKNHMIFIDGPGGTGKTFLYKTLIFYYLGQGKKIISMAWTGIASILLPEGMTTHRTFRLPLNLENIETTFLKLKSDKKKLRECDIIIWDEASMIPKKALEIIDKTLRDCCKLDLIPFGGKLIILGGDFRQILPVIKNGCRTSIVHESIKFSSLWPNFKILRLTKNMRSCNETYSKLLLKIGEGSLDSFTIPKHSITNNICEKIYGLEISKNEDLSDKAILACHNEDVNILNTKILSLIKSEKITYYSIDYAQHKGMDQTDENVQLNYSIEYLNSMKIPGLPNHKLTLKVGAVVMLIRNLSITDGLCNGTRLTVLKLYKYNIKVKIITGDKKGNVAFIPRITLNSGEFSNLPFILYRKQFPLVLAFAITIIKSQGQSFYTLGLYIRKPLFSHGQLYVALSRCKNPTNLYIENALDNEITIKNIVWKEIFN